MSRDRPWVDFQQAKEAISFADVLEAFGIADRFVKRGESFTGPCPLPQHLHNSIRPNPQQFKIHRPADSAHSLYTCFGDCRGQPHGGGDIITFIRAMLKWCPEAHVRLWLADKFGERLKLARPAKESPTAVPPTEAVTQRADKPVVPPVQSVPARPLKPLTFRLKLDATTPYLKDRGVTPEIIERYGLGLCKKGVLAGYIAIPIFRWPRPPDENPLGYIGRWPGEDFDEANGRPRYRVPTGFLTSQIVYGLGEALAVRPDSSQPLVIVEGCFKVYYLVQAGYAAVATLTASLSDEQADLLVKAGRPIVLMFDGNAHDAMRLAAAKVIGRSFVRVVKLEENVEPDHLSADELSKVLSFAK